MIKMLSKITLFFKSLPTDKEAIVFLGCISSIYTDVKLTVMLGGKVRNRILKNDQCYTD